MKVLLIIVLVLENWCTFIYNLRIVAKKREAAVWNIRKSSVVYSIGVWVE